MANRRHVNRYETSGCQSQVPYAAYTCYNQAPWVDDADPMLAYGFVASSPRFSGCNRCLELDFGASVGNYEVSDTGSKRLAAAGKRMIVQATNIGADVAEAQFDLMIPGGGVGLFQMGCHAQWGLDRRPEVDIGVQYGGMLSRCQGCEEPGTGCVPDRTRSHDEIRACVRGMCDATFSLPELVELKDACHWFVDWFEIADNPTLRFREVGCPQQITMRVAA